MTETTTRRPDVFPALHQRRPFALGLSRRGHRHSTGTAIDLTLVRLPVLHVPSFDPTARYGACTGPADQRGAGRQRRHGNEFDCFDTRSYRGEHVYLLRSNGSDVSCCNRRCDGTAFQTLPAMVAAIRFTARLSHVPMIFRFHHEGDQGFGHTAECRLRRSE